MRTSRDGGFTLVELIVVVMIIAVLIAIAIPLFLGARRAANNRAAQSLAREALASAKTLFQIDEDYTAASVTELQAAEPGINFVAGATSSANPQTVSVDAPDATTFIAAVYSKTGTCFYIRDRAVSAAGGTTYASKSSDGSDCTAGAPPAGSDFGQEW